eukprot:2403348-Rhodomonas_salina.1
MGYRRLKLSTRVGPAGRKGRGEKGHTDGIPMLAAAAEEEEEEEESGVGGHVGARGERAGGHEGGERGHKCDGLGERRASL